VVPRPYVYEGISVTPEFNDMVSGMKTGFQAVSALLGVALLWLARRFERPEIKAEFGLK